MSEVEQLKERLQAENVYLREEFQDWRDSHDLIGRSNPIKLVLQQIEMVAGTNATVLILGETGTGKELVARAVYARSSRSERPLVKVNCAALPETLVESELFGHEKGAFTGAITKRIGRFELASDATIFLDEIGELSLELQSKLLRVLQEGEFERLGSNKTIRVNVRVIAATNRDLDKLMAEGKFRSDLYYRLKVFPIQMPPLRVRRGDIPLLVWRFISARQIQLGKKITKVPREIMRTLQAFDWPGNIRELENVIERALIVSAGPVLVLAGPLTESTMSAARSIAAALHSQHRQQQSRARHIAQSLL